LKF
ncbi:hypothetical protein AB1N83_014418, partial [Pleurotus pulmonarius]|jgi:hypothetical protein